MPPEIIEDKVYDGRKADVFTLGVILFVIVQGKFPFSEAKKSDYFYKTLMNKEYDEYFEITWDEHCDPPTVEYKDLIA